MLFPYILEVRSGGYTMKRLVAFELEDKSTIVVETDELESGMTTRGFQHPQELVENASQTFAQALEDLSGQLNR